MTRDASHHDFPPKLREKFRINEACERFEDVWKAGPPKPQIADYIADWGEPSRSNLLRELLLIELHHRRRKDEEPTPEQYDVLLPEYAALIREVFADDKSHEFTKPWRGEGEPAKDSPDVADAPERQRDIPATEIPETIGRYRIEKVLGRGGFGLVYLAHDEQLDRRVAIKVPHAKLIAGPEDAEAYLTEARTVANLDHPNIVPVHDVGSTDDCPCYIVSKYIKGTDLATKLKQSRLKYTDAAELVATVAEALHYAHKQGLVHRDVKPGNILIGTDGQPYVVDFGLALREENIGKGPKHAGTPAYMSPEQARGEGHRVDGRSDIFSLGVVFYEMLVGNRPLKAESKSELLQLIATVETRPPRQVNDRIPKELERICLKTLSKRATDRYTTAKDLAEDLRHFLSTATPQTKPAIPAPGSPTPITPAGETQVASDTPAATPDSDSQPIKIVPKGLRSFDAHDADFFLELLPGPRDRQGLPDSIRFWKTRIEETDPDNTFSVGLIYGPSGCGKTSLVKAGLLPRLSEDVIVVYVEATAGETESRLLKGLRKRCPRLPSDLDLQQTLATLRRGRAVPSDRKVLIVLDQFEQWLHAKKEEENTELVQVLRQCDGEGVQCLVMVRDDFWLVVSRFFRDLEIRLVEGENIALTDLFDLDHARKNLAAFGQAFGKLPEDIIKASKEQENFLKQSVAGLAEDGKIICVRLALFAEMMKGKPWTAAALKEVGGMEGVGVTFLEETFSASTAPPEHRYHEKAARGILKALLPESGTDIKGEKKSYDELLEASGYASRPNDFDDLIKILDSEIRLITPTDPEGVEPDDESVTQTEAGQKYYQLTHDYLVHSLRDWLTRKQKETRKGQAELRLAERSALWYAKPENRHLPSLWEWASICTLTDGKKWSVPQRKMMGKAGRVHAVRSLFAMALVLGIVLSGIGLNNAATERRNDAEANHLVEGLLQADTAQVKTIIDKLSSYRKWAKDDLAAAFAKSPDESNAKLHAALAMLSDDDSVLRFLKDRLLRVSPVQFESVRDLLDDHKDDLIEDYWTLAEDAQQDAARRFQAACALASYDPNDERWNEIDRFVASHLVTVLPSELLPWLNALWPVRSRLLAPLEAIYKNDKESEQVRSFAADTLADYWSDDPEILFDLLADAERSQFPVVFDKLVAHQERAIELGNAEIDKSPAEDASEDDKEALAVRQANAAVMLLRMDASDQVWPLLRHSPDPRVRSYIIHWLRPRGGDPTAIVARFQEESDVTIKRALLLSLGEFDETQLGDSQRAGLIETLLSVYRSDPDSGLHAAAEWLLRQWKQGGQIATIDKELRQTEEQLRAAQNTTRQWYINGQGQTFVILDAGEFQMGSSETVSGHRPHEGLHRRRIGRRIAICTTEVTKAQWRQFAEAVDSEWPADQKAQKRYNPTDDSPMLAMKWYEAAWYCNWLSEQEGIPENQWCYKPNEDTKYGPGMKAKANFLELSGYRLPTEAEWEYACRAGAKTSRYYGRSLALLPYYAWYQPNGENHAWPVASLKPNDLGLFDMQGNAFEWCYNILKSYPVDSEDAIEDAPGTEEVSDTDRRSLRGGSFFYQSWNVRSASRVSRPPNDRNNDNGFRLARTYNLSP